MRRIKLFGYLQKNKKFYFVLSKPGEYPIQCFRENVPLNSPVRVESEGFFLRILNSLKNRSLRPFF
jgi:hypothetical protein